MTMISNKGIRSRLAPFRSTLAVAILLLFAFALRLYGIGFGLPALNDPDELMFEMGSMRMLRGLTLNPGWFGHPATTTMYILAIVNGSVFAIGHLIGWFPDVRSLGEALYADPSPAILPGRVIMALFSVGTVALTYRLARKLFDHATGLAAAALLAVNPVHILYSQVIRSDIMATFFMLLCMLAALRIARADRWRDYVLASLWLGLAMATKWPFAVTALGVAGAVALRHAMDPANRWRHVMRLALFGMLSLAFLCLVSPYLLLDHAKVLKDLQGEAQAHHLSATGGSPLWNAWWYIAGPIRAGLGILGLLLFAWGLQILARRRESLAILMPVLAGFFILVVVQKLVWVRWALPFMPILSIAAAAAAIQAARLVRTRLKPPVATPLLAAIAMLIAGPLLFQAESNASARLNDTRQQASLWARAHIPSGSTVLLEHFALDLVAQPWTFLFPLGDVGCVNANAWLKGQVGYAEIEQKRGARANVDYGTLAPDRVATCRADYAILTQFDRYRLERTTFPREYRAYLDLLARGRIVATFVPESGRAAGPIVRIVRFSDQAISAPAATARNARDAATFSPQDR